MPKAGSKFLAFDTETINRLDRGEACLLLAADGKGDVRTHLFPSSWAHCFDFLAKRKAPAYVAWNMDFDVRAIFHPQFVPYKVVEKVGLFGRATWGFYRFRYISSKVFEARHRDGRGFYLYDLKQFFGMSLAKASAKFVPGYEKHKIPQEWYNEMDRCLCDERRQEVLDYAVRDVEATQAILKVLLDSLKALDMTPTRLSSCASLARLRYGKRMSKVKAPDYINRKFQRGFFGGRIETKVLGVVRDVSLWDLNSAYPSVIASMKDPTKGVHSERGSDWTYQGADYGLYHVAASVPLDERFGPLAMKHHGRVFYPTGHVRTWCGVAGIEALREARIPFEVRHAYEVFDCPPEPILDDIEVLYKARKNPDGSETDACLAIKLCLNSVYGLWAEASNYLTEDLLAGRDVSGYQVRSRTAYGKLTNFMLAAHITESVRMKVWKVMRAAGDKCYFAATDGVLLDSSVKLASGPNLGEWGLKGTYKKGVILGCGRYYLMDGKKPNGKPTEECHLRGFSGGPELFERLKKLKRPVARIDSLDTHSLRQWAADFQADNFNVLMPSFKLLEVRDDKRFWPDPFPGIASYFRGTQESEPWIVGAPSKLAALVT